jgi:hypothetical protein
MRIELHEDGVQLVLTHEEWQLLFRVLGIAVHRIRIEDMTGAECRRAIALFRGIKAGLERARSMGNGLPG